MTVYRVTITSYPSDGPGHRYNSDLWNPCCGTFSTKQAALAAIAECFHKSRSPIPFTVTDGKIITSITPIPWNPPTFSIEALEVRE